MRFIFLDFNIFERYSQYTVVLEHQKENPIKLSCIYYHSYYKTHHNLFTNLHYVQPLAFTSLEIQLKSLLQKQSFGGVLKERFLKIFQNSQENTCARVSFLIKLQSTGLKLYQKGGSGTGDFLWILQIF